MLINMSAKELSYVPGSLEGCSFTSRPKSDINSNRGIKSFTLPTISNKQSCPIHSEVSNNTNMVYVSCSNQCLVTVFPTTKPNQFCIVHTGSHTHIPPPLLHLSQNHKDDLLQHIKYNMTTSLF